MTEAIILRNALEKELTAAEDALKGAFWKVSKLIEYDGTKANQVPGYRNPRGEVEKACAMLNLAAQYYDAVKAQLAAARTEGGRDDG